MLFKLFSIICYKKIHSDWREKAKRTDRKRKGKNRRRERKPKTGGAETQDTEGVRRRAEEEEGEGGGGRSSLKLCNIVSVWFWLKKKICTIPGLGAWFFWNLEIYY